MSPVRRCVSTRRFESARLSAIGISTSTCLPASRQAIACAACICVGVERMTQSTSWRARLSSRSSVQWPIPRAAAAALVLSSSRPTMDVTSTPSILAIASRCFWPKAPAAPATQTLILLLQFHLIRMDPGEQRIRPALIIIFPCLHLQITDPLLPADRCPRPLAPPAEALDGERNLPHLLRPATAMLHHALKIIGGAEGKVKSGISHIERRQHRLIDTGLPPGKDAFGKECLHAFHHDAADHLDRRGGADVALE